MLTICIILIVLLALDLLFTLALRCRKGHKKWQILKKVTIPMVMPSITVCTFLTLTNSFKLFDQNLALTNGEPSKMSEMMALNIFNTFYGRTGWEGVGQAKAVLFFVLVVAISMIQLHMTRSKEVQP